MTLRRPSWGNQFYPRDPDEASRMWEEFFSKCVNPRIKERIRAIQVPHAGWVYSGQAAAEAFIQLKEREIRTVVLVGPQHRVPAKHIQVFPDGAWESPLGSLEVDSGLASRFLEFDPAFKPDIQAHASEHSLEVQIPPLTIVLPGVKILPILTAPFQQDRNTVLSDALAEIVGKTEDTLILISTDLYHGESYSECTASDARTIEHVKSLDRDGLERALEDGSAAACGGDGLVALLGAAPALGIREARLLKAYNSNDVTGSRSGYVVGYSAFAFTG